jgi:methylenetetrahydrofolate dehydrogenase (NADP+)/methenyltetrahydrofolate cyclohydrolase
MTARLLDGKKLAAQRRAALAARIREAGFTPGLAVVRVGDDPASAVYVRNKARAAAEAGIAAATHHLPAETPEPALLDLIARLNADPEVDAILVQLPLPAGIDAERVIAAIDPAKDVDGFHPLNAGRLALGMPGILPCTPAGVLALIEETGLTLAGCEAVVVGRSRIVGRPMALLLLNRDASVTILHSRSREPAALCRRADLVIAAAGRPRLIGAEWIKPGAVVIDVGINRTAEGGLVGDVDFDALLPRASWITPVPGGVGPMTIAMLLENTLSLALARRR